MARSAGIAHYTCKDARDSFGSWLLTAGIPIQFISKWLNHSTIGITERNHTKLQGDEYRQPPQLAEGEVSSDLMARLVAENSRHQSCHHTGTGR